MILTSSFDVSILSLATATDHPDAAIVGTPKGEAESPLQRGLFVLVVIFPDDGHIRFEADLLAAFAAN